MPLVGGELARAAFEHGFEAYGADILAPLLRDASAQKGEAYLWYFPDGRAEQRRNQHEPRGAADRRLGVERDGVGADRGARGRRGSRAARWTRSDSRRAGRPPASSDAEVSVGYAASGASVRYRYGRDGNRISLEVERRRREHRVARPAAGRPPARRRPGATGARWPSTPCTSNPARTRTEPARCRARRRSRSTLRRHDEAQT